MADAVGPILAALKGLLEGATGATELHIDVGRFEHVEADIESIGANRCTRRPRPFNLRSIRLLPDGSTGDLTSGTYRRGAHSLEIWIGYGVSPHADLDLEIEIAGDEAIIRHVLEYEPNVALTPEWEGCEVVDAQRASMVDETDKPIAKILQLTIEVSHRERVIT
jgi:hypothetical protein